MIKAARQDCRAFGDDVDGMFGMDLVGRFRVVVDDPDARIAFAERV